MVELGERGVLGLQVEQGQLGGRFGFQRGLLVLGMTCVHGSVTIVDTLVSTVSPHRAATSRAATGSHVHSAAQCGTSMTAQASGTFAVLAHRVVAQVGRHVDVGAGRIGRGQQEVAGSPAQRDRAHRPVEVAGDAGGAAVGREGDRRRGWRSRRGSSARAAARCVRSPGRTAAAPRPSRSRRPPRTGARPASPRAPPRGRRERRPSRGGSRRRVSTSPTSPMAGVAPSSGRKDPVPGDWNMARS